MPVAFEARSQELIHYRQRQSLAEDPTPERQHVGIVVAPGESGRPLIVTESSPDTVDLVRRDRLALPRSTHDDPEIGITMHHGSPHRGTERWVVDRFLGIGSEIGYVVTGVEKMLRDGRLQGEAGMIGSKGDPHPPILDCAP